MAIDLRARQLPTATGLPAHHACLVLVRRETRTNSFTDSLCDPDKQLQTMSGGTAEVDEVKICIWLLDFKMATAAVVYSVNSRTDAKGPLPKSVSMVALRSGLDMGETQCATLSSLSRP
jgi:hypothetical protein